MRIRAIPSLDWSTEFKSETEPADPQEIQPPQPSPNIGDDTVRLTETEQEFRSEVNKRKVISISAHRSLSEVAVESYLDLPKTGS